MPERVLRALLLFLLLASPLLYIPGLRDPSSLPRYALLGLTAGLGLLIWLTPMAGWRPRLRVNALLVPVLLLLGWASLSLLWTVDPANGWIDLLQLAGLVAVFVLFAVAAEARWQGGLLIAAVTGATLAALVGTLQNFNLNPLGLLGFLHGPTYFTNVPSTFTNKNFASIYLDLILPMAALLVLLVRNRRSAWLAALGLALCLSYQLLAYTRGSWLGMLVAGGVLVVIVSRRPDLRALLARRIRLRAWPLLAALGVALALFMAPGKYDSRHVTRESSVTIRLVSYLQALELIRENPVLGTGVGGFRQAFRPQVHHLLKPGGRDRHLVRLHNDLLQYAVELGLPGALLALGIYIWALVLCLAIIRDAPAPQDKLMGLGLLLALMASGVHSGVDFPLHKPASALQFWAWLGLAAGLHARLTGRRPRTLKPSLAWPSAVAAVLFLGLNGTFYHRYLQSSGDLLLAEQSLRLGWCDGAKQAIDRGVSRFGLDFWSQYIRAEAHGHCPGEPRRRLAVMGEVLAYDPTISRALLTQGYLRAEAGEFQAALGNFSQVIDLLPNQSMGYIGLGYATLKAGRYAAAERFLKMALQAEPDNPEAQRLLAALPRLTAPFEPAGASKKMSRTPP